MKRRDLLSDWDGFWRAWEQHIGFEHILCMHLNDSKMLLGSRVDRDEWIGEGSLGPAPFRWTMRDRRFRGIIKVIETPKGNDPIRHDRRMLRRLRAYARRKGRRAVGRSVAPPHG